MEKKPLPPLQPEAEALLPPADLALKCSVFTASLGIDPGGSGISADVVVLVDTPLPWPKPVFDHPDLVGVDGKVTAHGRRIRVLASVPAGPEKRYVRVFQRTGGRTRSYRIEAKDVAPSSVVAGILADPDTPPTGAEPASDRAILVCTQGSHDVCCGSEGMALVSALAADSRFGGIDVMKVSHTGGHRFAPTAMTLPDGRMWAYATADRLAVPLFRHLPPSAVAPWCRGSWAAPDPRAQVAERLLFARGGWDEADLPIRFEELGDGSIRVTRGLDSYAVRVTVKRHVPVIRCRAAGGLPAKPGQEYRAELL